MAKFICKSCEHYLVCERANKTTTECTQYLVLVRCKDCKHRGDYPCPMYYEQLVEQNYGDGCIEYEWAEHDRTLDNGFCSMGERKDNG